MFPKSAHAPPAIKLQRTPREYCLPVRLNNAKVWYLEQVRRQRPRNPHHQIRVLPKEHGILTDFVIANDSVYLTSYDPGAEMIIQIKHPAYYNSMRSVFEFVWKNLPAVYP
jgi:hypothetical protein